MNVQADVERQRAQAQFRLLHGRLKSSLSLLQSVRSDKRSLEAIVRTLEAPSPLLAETQTKARQLTRLQEAKKHLQVLSKVYDLTYASCLRFKLR